jgi:HK97 gp10 family phage protein
MRIETTLTGADDVRRILDQIGPREAKNIMRATVGDMAAGIRKDARQEAPVDDGDLKRSIKVKRRRVVMGRVRADVVVERKAFYWRFVEYGTREQSENAFFTRALEKFRGQAMDRFLGSFVKKFEARLARLRNNGR